MEIKQNLVSPSKYGTKCPYPLKPEYVVIHNTANDASPEAEISYMIGNANQVSFHVAVGPESAVQGIPFDRNAWHCGDGAIGTGNRKGIGIEICYSKSGGDLFDKSEANAVVIAAQLLKQFNLDISRLKRHADFSNKNCPHRTMEKGWSRFVQLVKDELMPPIPATPTTPATPVSPDYKIGTYGQYVETTTALNIRDKRDATSALEGTLPKGTKVKVNYILGVKDSREEPLWGSVFTTYGDGFINLNYTKPCSVPAQEEVTDTYTVEILANALNVRKMASFEAPVVMTVGKGEVYTIVDESNGLGKLKSGAGWISLNAKYVKKH